MADFVRLRPICLVAAELEPAVETLRVIFGLGVCHRDAAVAQYGLANALQPIGPGSSACRCKTAPGCSSIWVRCAS